MKTTKQIQREARQLFRLCLVDGFLDERRVLLVLRGILESGRRGGHAVLTRFLRLVKLDVARHTAAIESATSLPSDLRASVVAGVERVYGPRMSSSFSMNPALIGGMRIRVASDVYDSSVKARLAELERRF